MEREGRCWTLAVAELEIHHNLEPDQDDQFDNLMQHQLQHRWSRYKSHSQLLNKKKLQSNEHKTNCGARLVWAGLI